MKLSIQVQQDEFTAKVANAFDLDFAGIIETEIPDFTLPTEEYNIGLIVGSSGSGKSTILQSNETAQSEWDRDRAIVSHFNDPDEAIEKLHACGIASIPTLCKPYHVLSNGEKYRADFARKLHDGVKLDEFTSEVNRETAKSLCVSVSKYIRRKGIKNITLASCHSDIISWLQPDWVFDCDKSEKFLNDDPISKLKKVARIEVFAPVEVEEVQLDFLQEVNSNV